MRNIGLARAGTPAAIKQVARAGFPLVVPSFSESEKRGKGGYELGLFMAVKLTYEMLHACSTDKGGWNWCQLKLLGVRWPPYPGWLSKLVDVEISPRTWELVMRLKDCPTKAERARMLDAYGLNIKTLSQKPDRGPMNI